MGAVNLCWNEFRKQVARTGGQIACTRGHIKVIKSVGRVNFCWNDFLVKANNNKNVLKIYGWGQIMLE